MNNKVFKSALFITVLSALSVGNNAFALDNLSLEGNRFSANYHSVIAQNKRFNRGERREQLMENLNLSNEQTQKIENIRSKYQPQMENLEEQIVAERETLSDMLKRNDSESRLRSQHQKITSLNQKMQNLRFESMLEMRAVLTPQQRQEWTTMMEDKRSTRRNNLRQ